MTDDRDDTKIENMALRLAKLNPDFVRDICGSHFVRFEGLEFSQGKLTKAGKVEKNYKEQR